MRDLVVPYNVSFGEHIPSAPAVRPSFNVGCLLDLQTGDYHTGRYGESIVNGGLLPFTGVGGKPNSYKSSFMSFLESQTFIRYAYSAISKYDSETTSSIRRQANLAYALGLEDRNEILDSPRYTYTDGKTQTGDQYYNKLREYNAKKATMPLATTPFLDKDGNPIQTHYVSVASIDSLSRTELLDVEKRFDGNDPGSSDSNMESANYSKAKKEFVIRLGRSCRSVNTALLASAHVKDNVNFDPRSIPEKATAFFSNKLKFVDVPNQFLFLTDNLWYLYGAKPFTHDKSKGAMWPYRQDDKDHKTNELMSINVIIVRGKGGMSGIPHEIIASQSEGVIPYLTELKYVKHYDSLALGGSAQNFYLHLMPDVKLMRTTVREKFRESAPLRRAMEISAELQQLLNDRTRTDIDPDILCDHETLFTDIKKKYDWDELLATRGWWTYDEDNHPLNFLSTKDLLNMRAGRYKPYWM